MVGQNKRVNIYFIYVYVVFHQSVVEHGSPRLPVVVCPLTEFRISLISQNAKATEILSEIILVASFGLSFVIV